MKLFLIALFLAGACLVLFGCSTTAPGLAREQSAYSFGTNAVAIVSREVVPFVPAPYSSVLLGILAAASAGLGAWNTWQQRELTRLRNGAQTVPRNVSGNGAGGASGP